ncbi:MAG: sialidase, partial [Candidatus Aminicenantes bacterium]|nr:sialidase [Candidatus Aminicenantes bacterium]
VRKDPRSAGSLADIQEQVSLQLEIRDDLNTCSDMISRLEWMRKQLCDLKDVLSSGKAAAETIAAIGQFDSQLQSVESELFQKTIAEGDTKSFRDPQKIYMKLAVLAGDISNSVDFAPNEQQREVLAVLKERLAVQKARFEELTARDLPDFNGMLREKGISGIILPDIQ